MIAISTSFLATQTSTPEIFVQSIRDTGADAVELDYRIDEKMLAALRPLVEQASIKVTSIHNYFPIPAEMPDSKGSGDLFLLSSLDEDHRKTAVKYTLRTIDWAAELGARSVVLHCGRVEMDEERELVYHYLKTGQMHSPEAIALMESKFAERERLKTPFVNQLIKSLDELSESARSRNITLGLENRYHYHELPGPNELPTLFRALDGAPLGYWHDTGHAQMLELLKVVSAKTMLEQNSDRLIGMHLHDAVGRRDHLPPGQGEIEFKALLPYLTADVLKVMELRPGTPVKDAAAGLSYLRAMIQEGSDRLN